MTITIDILSLILGIFIGVFITTIAVTCVYFDDRWHTGFGCGWERGCKYGKETAQKEENE